jgi:hypothetical protein
MLCPCWLGPEGTPDLGWCAGVFAFDIREGESDGIKLDGSRVAFAAEWPGNFFGGNGTFRLYVDERTNDDQRRELEAIFSGRKGGHLEGLLGAVITRRLPATVAKIEIVWNDKPSVTVAGIGQATLRPLRDQAGFLIDSMDLASSKGSRWADPEMRAWEGDSGTLHAFNWTA